jgi:hypothetical protein
MREEGGRRRGGRRKGRKEEREEGGRRKNLNFKLTSSPNYPKPLRTISNYTVPLPPCAGRLSSILPYSLTPF